MLKHAIALVFSVTILASASANAESPAAGDARRGLQHARVALSDLDLASPAGAQDALARIQAAAQDMCAWRGSLVHPSQLRWIRNCTAEGVAHAVAELDAPAVTALHAANLQRAAAR